VYVCGSREVIRIRIGERIRALASRRRNGVVAGKKKRCAAAARRRPALTHVRVSQPRRQSRGGWNVDRGHGSCDDIA
jgi:hypothetical protein